LLDETFQIETAERSTGNLFLVPWIEHEDRANLVTYEDPYGPVCCGLPVRFGRGVVEPIEKKRTDYSAFNGKGSSVAGV
jgi:hypothetical protein